VLGWAGAAWIDDEALIVVSALGCGYIVYLASKIARSSVDISEPANAPRLVNYRDGLVMQLLNPKAILATLPITTLQFPAADIHGFSLVFWAFGLAMLAAGAPGSYIVIGSVVGSRIKNPGVVKGFNWVMAGLLIAVALSIGYEHVWLSLTAQS
ncbi:MAG: LysE family translocator, partial [Halomonas sp.]